MSSRKVLELLKKNVGKSVGFRIGTEFIQCSNTGWYILPFTDDDDEWVRVVSLSQDDSKYIFAPETVISDCTILLDGKCERVINFFKIKSITSLWIY